VSGRRAGSGEDPMVPAPNGADGARAMNTALLHPAQVARRGRFGRDVPTSPPLDDLQHPPGHEQTEVYVIDANAVAEAILARLIAGRTLPVAPPPDQASR
jgi:hypothetical protein